ncbi:NAD-dependent protein deacetylase Sirt2 [Porphyridium purpureum]|uniref:NAD-dependent protein deacetylase Sirt2 n=1 Tax=Porphyridium purpureum TaxID=35688 RepID=A0A5J4Z209_PORPP|nr:NAD-dependent protein deacetylase Sirt2 [Porphyridium purpureum]|eukprot:POR0054..scf208_2
MSDRGNSPKDKVGDADDENEDGSRGGDGVDDSVALAAELEKVGFNETRVQHSPQAPPEKAEKPRQDAAIDALAQELYEGKYKNILVIAGAGVSTAAGVPDFRSPKTGLYANLGRFKLESPTDVFDISYFRTNPEPFYVLSRDLYRDDLQPTCAHRFLQLLDRQGLLLRLYTQNIDGLDRKAGIRDDKIVEAHGSYASASCIACREPCGMDMVLEHMRSEPIRIPKCGVCSAFIKPDITFFGESLPDRFYELLPNDVERADFVFVMGTSLKVMPVAGIVSLIDKNIKRVLINREMVGDFDHRRDTIFLGDIETTTSALHDAYSSLLAADSAPSATIAP